MSCRSRRVPTEQRIAKEGERTLSTLPRQAGLEASHGGGLGLEVTADVMPLARGTHRDNGLHKNENAAVPLCHVKQVQHATVEHARQRQLPAGIGCFH